MKNKKKEKPKVQKTAQSKDKAGEGLRGLIEDLQKEKDELFGQLQRVSADYANFQKRASKQNADAITYEKERIIKTLLPALDNFEHTLQNAHTAENVDVLIKGVQIVYDQLLDILKSHDVEQIKALGENFDPALHQAMMQRFEADKEENTVLEEFQTGYTLNGRVIRPSKVIVNKQPPEQTGKQEQTDEPEQTTDTQ